MSRGIVSILQDGHVQVDQVSSLVLGTKPKNNVVLADIPVQDTDLRKIFVSFDPVVSIYQTGRR